MKKIKGFSLLELMVVVVIIGILAAIAIPNFIRLKDRAKESEVKANAHTSHLAAEEYATGADGYYIPQADFINLPMLSNLKNPFVSGGVAVSAGAPSIAGCVGYNHGGYSVDPYTIVAAGKEGSTDTILVLCPSGSF
ncbi:MAG: hypothetical protein APR63_08890 [Desulfuromonas sp. SDB]|nr:MAG: hypothetical protein APR63_08890 [Desulfuromonas sp. SDB]